MVANREHFDEKIDIAVILADKAGRIQWVNEGFTEITGYSLNEVVGKQPKILQGKNTEPHVVQEIREALNKRVPIRTDITNYRKDGGEYLCKLVIYPIFNEEGEHTNFIAFEVDGNRIPENARINLLELQPRYQSSSLTEAKALDIFARLNALFENEKIYLQPNLRLRDVAERIGTNTRYLSQVINIKTGGNVLHFINRFRVRDTKQKIADPTHRHLTAYGIAQLCGFRNKSTFYKVFKEFEGLTPKEYVREVASRGTNQ